MITIDSLTPFPFRELSEYLVENRGDLGRLEHAWETLGKEMLGAYHMSPSKLRFIRNPSLKLTIDLIAVAVAGGIPIAVKIGDQVREIAPPDRTHESSILARSYVVTALTGAR